MATYLDGLTCVYKSFVTNPPAASAQLILLHLLHENHCLGDTGTIQITDRELGYRTRLNKQTVIEAKRTLKNLGLIDFKTDRKNPRHGTTYTLTVLNSRGSLEGHSPAQPLGQSITQQPDQSIGQRVGQTLDQNGSISYTRAHGITNNLKNTKSLNHNQSDNRAREVEELKEEWIANGGVQFSELVRTKLEALLDTYAPETIKFAIEEAGRNSNSKYGFSLNFFQCVLENRKIKKSGESRVSSEINRDERDHWEFS